jgi:hypothetical protein
MLKGADEMPHSTHVALPVLQPRTEPEVEAVPMDAEDAADLESTPPPARQRGVQATHITPPDPGAEPVIGNIDPDENP